MNGIEINVSVLLNYVKKKMYFVTKKFNYTWYQKYGVCSYVYRKKKIDFVIKWENIRGCILKLF